MLFADFGDPAGGLRLSVGLGGLLSNVVRRAHAAARSIVGVVVASVALVNGFALAYAPLGYEPSNAVQPLWQTPPDRPYVPPPAMPGRVYKHVTKRADKAS